MIPVKTKKVEDSSATMSEIVLPNDANTLGKLRGGKLIDWMDIAGEITAQRHSGLEAVTASIAHVCFRKSINIGDIVTIKAMITRAFNTSMEIKIEVWSEDKSRREKTKTNEAIFTYVAVNEQGKPCSIPPIMPVGEHEEMLYAEAGERKLHRLKKAT